MRQPQVQDVARGRLGRAPVAERHTQQLPPIEGRGNPTSEGVDHCEELVDDLPFGQHNAFSNDAKPRERKQYK